MFWIFRRTKKNKATISCFSKYVPSFCNGSTGLLKIILDQTSSVLQGWESRRSHYRVCLCPGFTRSSQQSNYCIQAWNPKRAMRHPGHPWTYIKSERKWCLKKATVFLGTKWHPDYPGRLQALEYLQVPRGTGQGAKHALSTISDSMNGKSGHGWPFLLETFSSYCSRWVTLSLF